jgi:hypothetical protein
MQINAATLLASQQSIPAQGVPAPGFAAALEKSEGFAPLPLKQMAPADESVAAKPSPIVPRRLGATLDIKV